MSILDTDIKKITIARLISDGWKENEDHPREQFNKCYITKNGDHVLVLTIDFTILWFGAALNRTYGLNRTDVPAYHKVYDCFVDSMYDVECAITTAIEKSNEIVARTHYEKPGKDYFAE